MQLNRCPNENKKPNVLTEFEIEEGESTKDDWSRDRIDWYADVLEDRIDAGDDERWKKDDEDVFDLVSKLFG